MLDLFGEAHQPTLWEFEEMAFRRGYVQIAGIDEAGRGPLAGPVVAAAVILPKGTEICGINDSKKLTASARAELYDVISAKACAIGIGSSDHDVIDRVNILQATLAAMKQAVLQLKISPDYLLVDGISKVPVAIPQKTIKKGDGASISIAAASIMAKVTRDRLMVEYDRKFPGYGFADHKGYGCTSHLAAIASLGPSAIHRKTFRGVREHIATDEQGFCMGDCLK